MVVLGTTIHEFRCAEPTVAAKLVDPRAKHEDDEKECAVADDAGAVRSLSNRPIAREQLLAFAVEGVVGLEAIGVA
jgi:hypothetical protein